MQCSSQTPGEANWGLISKVWLHCDSTKKGPQFLKRFSSWVREYSQQMPWNFPPIKSTHQADRLISALFLCAQVENSSQCLCHRKGDDKNIRIPLPLKVLSCAVRYTMHLQPLGVACCANGLFWGEGTSPSLHFHAAASWSKNLFAEKMAYSSEAPVKPCYGKVIVTL